MRNNDLYSKHYHGPALTHMRNVISKEADIQIFRTMDRSEKMRDDEALLKAAEEKRQRKQAKRAALAAKSKQP